VQLCACIDAVLEALQQEQSVRARLYAKELLKGRRHRNFDGLITLLEELKGNNAHLAANAAPFSFDNLAGRISQELQDYHDVLPLILLHLECAILRDHARAQKAASGPPLPTSSAAETASTAQAASFPDDETSAAQSSQPHPPLPASISSSLHAHAAVPVAASAPPSPQPHAPATEEDVFNLIVAADEPEVAPTPAEEEFDVDGPRVLVVPSRPVRVVPSVSQDSLMLVDGVELDAEFNATLRAMFPTPSSFPTAGPVATKPRALAATAMVRKMADPPRMDGAPPSPLMFTPSRAATVAPAAAPIVAPFAVAGWTSAIRGRATPVRDLSPELLRRYGVVTPDGSTPTEGSLLTATIRHVDARPLLLSARTLHPAQFPRAIACAPLQK
jgi:hypothetical protein